MFNVVIGSLNLSKTYSGLSLEINLPMRAAT